MFDLRLRYLASVFVDAASIRPCPENIRKLSEALDDEKLIPTTVREPTPSGTVPRIAFTTSEGEWLLALLSNRFDLSLFGGPESTPVDFSDFCREAIAKLTIPLNSFERRGHRLAAVEEGFLRDMSKKRMEEIANRLFRFPPLFSSYSPFEWDWRAASVVDRSFGGLKEPTNTLVTIKRLAGERAIKKEDDQQITQRFERIRIDFDINTTPKNVTARFDETHITSFFEHAPVWHDELCSEISSFILGESK